MPKLRPPGGEPEVTLKSEATEALPEVEVVEPQVEVVEPEPKPDETVIALKEQLEALKKSEQLAKSQLEREREDARRMAREREAQLAKVQKEAHESQFDAVSSALSAAQAEADKAQQDIENAIAIGDAKGQAEAYRRLALATANLTRLEEGKQAIETRNKEFSSQPQPQQQDQLEVRINQSGLPNLAKDWLRAHPDYLIDPEKNAQIQWLHHVVVKEGHVAFSKEYLESMENHLGLRQPEVQKQAVQQPSQQRNINVSAPVSRDVPSSDGSRPKGKVSLTREEQEYAKVSGVSVEEYAKQKLKLAQMRANGEYSEQQR